MIKMMFEKNKTKIKEDYFIESWEFMLLLDNSFKKLWSNKADDIWDNI